MTLQEGLQAAAEVIIIGPAALAVILAGQDDEEIEDDE